MKLYEKKVVMFTNKYGRSQKCQIREIEREDKKITYITLRNEHGNTFFLKWKDGKKQISELVNENLTGY